MKQTTYDIFVKSSTDPVHSSFLYQNDLCSTILSSQVTVYKFISKMLYTKNRMVFCNETIMLSSICRWNIWRIYQINVRLTFGNYELSCYKNEINTTEISWYGRCHELEDHNLHLENRFVLRVKVFLTSFAYHFIYPIVSFDLDSLAIYFSDKRYYMCI